MKIYPERDGLLSQQGFELVTSFYLQGDETSPQQAYARAATYASGGDEALAQRLYDYVSQQWFMFASPILSNARAAGEPRKGLPISCFLSYVPDTLEGLIGHSAELKWLSVMGGGVGGHWGQVRAVSKKAPGPIPFMKDADATILAYKQGETRKGSYAAYLDVSHPDVMEFLELRIPTGGDINRKCLNIHNAINLPDAFMYAVASGSSWELICPASGEVREEVDARTLWEKIMETRDRTGEPYLNFIDEANRQMHPALQARGLRIHGSNLCNEIHLPTDDKRTAVCCLSSVNLEKWDEWQNHPTFIEDLVTMLDNVLDVFIEDAGPELSRAVYSATQSRDIGLGAMGFHGLLQSRGIEFESDEARRLNTEVFSEMYLKGRRASRSLGKLRGCAPDLRGSKFFSRNCHIFAVAPNANSSIIAGCSASIEPIKSNAYVHNTRVGSHAIRNPHLKSALNLLGLDTPEIWKKIIAAEGSVLGLGVPPEVERVFRTAFEIDQHWAITHAADRQPFICQGQSVNLFFPTGSSRCYVNSVHLSAWKKKLKGLYYYRTQSAAKAEAVGASVVRVKLQTEEEECMLCHA